jgi:hypothetical protein
VTDTVEGSILFNASLRSIFKGGRMKKKKEKIDASPPENVDVIGNA